MKFPTIMKFKPENTKPVMRHRFQECQLCHGRFLTHKKHILFCDSCRNHSEKYHFAEWLPETSIAI